MKRRIGALLTAAALVLSLLTTAALAAETTLTVKTPETIPKAGEEFTVTVELSGNPGFNAIDIRLPYDRDEMTCTYIETSYLTEGDACLAEENTPKGAVVSSASLKAKTGDGMLAVFHFKAERDLSELHFKLEETELFDEKGKAIPIHLVGAEWNSTEEEPPQQEDSPTPSGTTSNTGATTPSTGGAAEMVAECPFPDAVGHWGEAWIIKAAERGLFSGDDKGFFRPDVDISRGDYVLVLWRMAGKPEPKAAAPFADVPENAYYAKAVAWAAEQGYVNGKGSGFAPKDSLTRQEAMKILFGYAGGVEGMGLIISYYDGMIADSGEIASWAKSAMYWAYSKAIISGTGANKLSPTMTATRAQLAKILVGYQDINI